MKLQAEDRDLIRLALREDLSLGDPTTAALVGEKKVARALIFARAKGIASGLNIAKKIFKTLDPSVKFKLLVPEGSQVKTNMALAEVRGKAVSLFKGERIVLNFIQHLSGISTYTNKFVKSIKKGSIKITDTRKTTPGLRHLEKYAVKIGGGNNHRMTLGDFILIKDNHWRFLPENSLSKGVKEIRRRQPRIKIEVEVKKIPELKKALEAKVDVIMLDNMSYKNLRKTIKLIKSWQITKKRNRLIVEISGGINLNNIGRLSQLGVNQISIGALTHSAPAFPVDMEIMNE